MKTDHPAHPSLCARHADNYISFYFVVFILHGNYSLRRGAALITIE